MGSQKIRPLSNRIGSKTDLIFPSCKKCDKIYTRKWQVENPEKVKLQGEKYNKIHRTKIKQRKRNCNLKNTYNITEQDYQKILIKQDYKCAYTNNKLIPRINMTLDHKIPISRDPELAKCIDNVHWVIYSVNVFKNYMTHNEFLQICKTIYENLELNKTSTININTYKLDIVPARRIGYGT